MIDHARPHEESPRLVEINRLSRDMASQFGPVGQLVPRPVQPSCFAPGQEVNAVVGLVVVQSLIERRGKDKQSVRNSHDEQTRNIPVLAVGENAGEALDLSSVPALRRKRNGSRPPASFPLLRICSTQKGERR